MRFCTAESQISAENAVRDLVLLSEAASASEL